MGDRDNISLAVVLRYHTTRTDPNAILNMTDIHISLAYTHCNVSTITDISSGDVTKWSQTSDSSDLARVAIGLGLIGLGVILASVSALDIYEDVFLADKSLLLNVGENTLPLVFHGLLIAVGIWLLRGDVDTTYVQSVGQWVSGAVVAVVLLGVWVYFFQVLQDSIKPAFVFAHLLGAAGTAGIAIGLYDAAQTTRTRELEQYETIISSVSDQVYVLDSNGRVVFANEQFATFLNATPDEIIGSEAGTIFEETGTIQTAAEQIVTGASEQETVEVTVSTQGRDIPCETDLSSLPEKDGTVVGVLRDISHRQAVESELESERNRLSILYQSIPDPVAETELVESGELDAKLVSVNEAFETDFGCTADDVQGEWIGSVVKDTDGRGLRPESAEPLETEISCRTADGIRTYLLRMIPFEIDNRREAYWLFTDITDQTMRRRRLRVLNRVMRHNLRNDMTVMTGQAQRLTDHADEEVTAVASEIVDAGSEITAMVNRLREIDEMIDDSDRHEPQKITDVIDRAFEQARAEGIETESVTVDVDEPYVVRADDVLGTAIAELVVNAFAHSDRESPAVGITVDSPDDQWIELRILDDGPGIPEHERIPLEDGDITQLQHASGIGLWMVSWIVSSLGGEVNVSKNMPRGTVVTLRLPNS